MAQYIDTSILRELVSAEKEQYSDLPLILHNVNRYILLLLVHLAWSFLGPKWHSPIGSQDPKNCGFCINQFLVSPLHYLSSRSDFGFEFVEVFV
jgi:hypothetical protein